MSDSTDSKAVSIGRTPEAVSPVLTEAELHEILVEWNRTERDYPRDKCVQQLFEEQVERTPDAVAVVFEEQSLTYRELNARSNRVANHLRSLGVRPESLVALCLERSLEMVVSILGTLKAGAAYVPIDPAYPADRVAFMLSDANAPVLLTQEALREKLPPTPAKIICLDSGWEIIRQESEAAPATGVAADNLAYVIYTSGSTGRPKGAMNTHRGICNRLFWMQEMYHLTEADHVLQKTPFSFDVSVWEFLWPLLAGARLVIARPDGHRDNKYLIHCISSQQITTLHFVPSMLRHFLRETEVGNCPSLRRVFCGGETLPPDLQEFFFNRLPGVALHNLYGPTEAAVDVTHWTCRPDSGLRIVPIGRPIANIQIYILNEARQPVPVGVEGELHIGGAGLARGYLNRPELTAERFIPNPFSSKPDARLYRTGDLARWRPDGNIEFLGRMDQQVKIRGFRIELGEIESVLCQHPALSDGAVTAQPDDVNEMELTAFVVARDASALSVGLLRQWLAKKLPDYMIPSRFVAVPSLPLNPNGKLDRKALGKMDGMELASGTDYAAPRNEQERKLVETWQAVLRRERIGIQDNFFHLGGHSLLAAVICSHINRRLGIEVSLRSIFEHPTIAGLAKHIAPTEGHQQNVHPIAKADRRKPLPMSFGQQGMWLLQQTLPEAATYNEPVAWRLSGRVNREKIRRVLQTILERHEVMRTALVQQGENLVQQIAGAKEVSLPWQGIDIRAVPPDQKEEVLAGRLLGEARRPFDLAQAPLWRVVWIDLAAEDQVLAFTFHHSIVDEWSSRLFFQEFERLYATGGHAERAGLPALPVQYADYAVWQRQRLNGELLETQRRYWREQLRELPASLKLPAEKTRILPPGGRGAIHHFQLPIPVVNGLRELARQEETTVFTVMLAAFQVWLHRHTGQTDLIVGTPAADRYRPEVQALLGLFLNTLPIRSRLDGSRCFRELLRQVRATILDAFSHADLPFEQMVELAVKEREPGNQPLFQVMFVLLEEGLPPLHLDQARSRLMPMNTGTSKNDLTLNIQAVGGSWDCQLEYATDLFSPDGAARMARNLAELFRTITENSRAPVGQLRLMPEEERRQILVEWNRTERDYPRDKCIHQLFEEQVERTHDVVAAEFEGNSLTYRELNERSNRLAHELRKRGVGPDSPVALCVERSLEMVVGLLGILKAGGAYVPLDPSHPPERLASLIKNTVTPVLVTQAVLAKRFSSFRAETICFENLQSEGAVENPCVPISTKNLAYVLYTSGSTGRPKGVAMEHGPLVNLMQWQMGRTRTPLRTLQFASPCFDVSFQEIFSTWLSGGTLVLVDSHTRLNPSALWEFVAARKLERLFLPVVMLQHLAEAAERSQRTAPELRQVITAGEQLRITPAIRSFFAVQPGRTLHNHYGPTESHVVTAWTLPAGSTNWPELPPIGRPIANTTIYLLDGQMGPVPVGLPGELYIGGGALARGYWNQPELTAERFIPDPFSGKPDARLYRTGDLARWRPDGNLEFLGRLDSQVKIRGFRIELGEIETVLCAQPEVRDAVVVVREDISGDKRLVSYLVAKAGEKPDALTLRKRLAEKLPDYMIPAAFVWLDQLPLTPNGKVDRKALPAPETNDDGGSDVKCQPVNLLELELIRIWRRLFQRENIGRQDNFFLLGGHSLMAVRLAAEIDRLLKCKLPIATLFQSPTIESLARRLADDNWTPPWSSLVPLQPQGSKPPLFFVHGWGGDVYGHLELARLLPPDQPSYGIQAVGLDGKSARHIAVEDMAAHYVKEIVSFQPDGPLYLAGYSMGGLIAFEVAQQLHRLGRRVALLALLDSSPIGKIPWVFYGLSMATYIPDRCLFHFRRWLKLSRHEKSGYLRGRWIALRFWLVRNRSRVPFVTVPPQPAGQPPQVPGFGDYYHAVAAAYRVRPYPGSADVFVSEQASPGWKWWYWRHFARGGVTLHRIPGSHLQILLSPDFIPELAKSLASALHRTQEKERANHSRDRHNPD